MNQTSERRRRQARLARVTVLLRGAPSDVGLGFERARLLDDLGQTDAARDAYLAVLHVDSTHAGALNDLGRLLDRTGFHTAARSAYERAVAAHPTDSTSHGNLATSLLDAGDAVRARTHYETAVRLDPTNAAAHKCLAILALREGERARARHHARIGFKTGATSWPFRGSGRPIPVLVVHSALGGNVTIDRFIDDRTFAKWTLVAEFADRAAALPPHALVINAIGDADRCGIALRAAQALVRTSPVAVINAPHAVRLTGRRLNARRLQSVPGVLAPRVVSCSRRALSAPGAAAALAARGVGLPLILRAPGFHTGMHCVRVDAADELAPAVAGLPGESFLAIAFVDVRATDAKFRKYRVMCIGGTLFPLHLAISRHWMVHYFSSDMADEPEQRALEKAFLADMRGTLGPAALAALGAVAATLGLDYGGIDFALDAAGRVVVFEANATMNVLAPPPGDSWSYRRLPVERIEAALRSMLLERAARALDGRETPLAMPGLLRATSSLACVRGAGRGEVVS